MELVWVTESIFSSVTFEAPALASVIAPALASVIAPALAPALFSTADAIVGKSEGAAKGGVVVFAATPLLVPAALEDINALRPSLS